MTIAGNKLMAFDGIYIANQPYIQVYELIFHMISVFHATGSTHIGDPPVNEKKECKNIKI